MEPATGVTARRRSCIFGGIVLPDLVGYPEAVVVLGERIVRRTAYRSFLVPSFVLQRIIIVFALLVLVSIAIVLRSSLSSHFGGIHVMAYWNPRSGLATRTDAVWFSNVNVA